MNAMKKCTIVDCGSKLYANGMCEKHYDRVRRHGRSDICLKPKAETGAPLKFIKSVVLPFDSSQCLTWPFYRRKNGYGEIRTGGKMTGAHRLVCALAHGEPPSPKHEAAHSCGKGHEGCVNPDHLRWATPFENANDRASHGTIPFGERAPSAKLTRDDVVEIRALAGSVSQRMIAARFGISHSNVCRIVRGRTWVNAIPDQPVPSNFKKLA